MTHNNAKCTSVGIYYNNTHKPYTGLKASAVTAVAGIHWRHSEGWKPAGNCMKSGLHSNGAVFLRPPALPLTLGESSINISATICYIREKGGRRERERERGGGKEEEGGVERRGVMIVIVHIKIMRHLPQL